MKKSILFCYIFLGISFCCEGQTASLANRLGYPENAKLLIIHADDLGVSHSENMASIKGIKTSPVNSGSIMVPCPWFPEIAAYASKNKSLDFGLHLTLNSEWINYKWAPVTSKDKVPSLVNNKGYFYAQIDSVGHHADSTEVAIELRNQIKKAYDFGIDVTHLDAHMGTAVSTPQFLATYIRLGQEFKLPVLLSKQMPFINEPQIQKLLTPKDVLLDSIYTAGPKDFENGMQQYYTAILEKLTPGVSIVLIHLAYDDKEMKAVTKEHQYWAADWRQEDFNFFTSDTCKKLLEDNNIILITWRELRDKITRSPN